MENHKKENKIKEIWKPIKGYEEKYLVSNIGNVKSLNYANTGESKNLKLQKDIYGYIYTTLSLGKKKKVHRLVAEAFINNPLNNPVVNHKDEIKDNNVYTNLEWVTLAQNTKYSKGIDVKFLWKNNIVTFPSILEASTELGIDCDVVIKLNRDFIKLLNTVQNLLDNNYSKNIKFKKRSTMSSNTSGYAGVTLREGKWISRVGVNGKRHYLGEYETIEDAVTVRNDFIIENNINSPLQGGDIDELENRKILLDSWKLLSELVKGQNLEIDMLITNINKTI